MGAAEAGRPVSGGAFAISRLMSFSSRPGSSALMRTSLSVSSMSICGQPPIHFAVQRKEWMYVGCAVDAHLASFVVPASEIW